VVYHQRSDFVVDGAALAPVNDTVDCLPVGRFERYLGLAGLGRFAEVADIADWEQSLFHPLGLAPCWRKRGRAILELDLE